MINFKKGPALSLHQVNYVAAPASGVTGIEAGHVVRVGADGLAYKGIHAEHTAVNDDAAVYGFAINNQTAGDVIESGKIGIYALDGATVIETDKFTNTSGGTLGQGASSFVPGKYVSADANGNIFPVASDDVLGGENSPLKIIGQVVEASRVIPNKATAVNASGFQYQTSVTVVCIKLAI